MRRDKILRVLREHRADLAQFGLKSLALFGSVVRDEAGPQSDVDVLVEFDEPPTFDRYMDLKFYLEDLLGLPVDLVPRHALKRRLRPYVEREAIYVA